MNPDKSLALLKKCVDIYAEDVKRRGEREYCVEYPVIRAYFESLSS
jgi:uncharacterized Fe-S radical SAM superfamily protein PflX